MKKLIALVVAAFALAGCSNFVADFGIPSVRFSSTGYGPTTNGYEVSFEIQPYPGSSSSQILHINILINSTAARAAGVTVPECPPLTLPDACPKIGQTLSFVTNPGPIKITGYEAQSLNGTIRTITLSSPVIINP